MGIKISPAPTLATAPVVKFARLLNFGKLEEWLGLPSLSKAPIEARRFERATFERRVLREVK